MPTNRLFRLSASQKQDLAHRDRVIAALGLAPEDRSCAAERYVGTTAEFEQCLAARGVSL